MSKITLRTIEAKNLTISADKTGCVWVNGRNAGQPVKHDGLVFVWGSKDDGLPVGSKIALTAEHMSMIAAHSAAYIAERKEQARKEREYDLSHNEGGAGFNPFRQ
tara:strand:- start:367 stop:681 length:315 start_codon:yes stop_codon:yes gene_type:complete